MRTIHVCTLLAALALAAQPAPAQDMPAAYRQVLAALGRPGDFSDGVLKIGLPRRDLAMTIDGVRVPTALGFAGWVAFTRGDSGMDVLMGDLVLTQDEVNPVMSALIDHGLDVTALHNHFFWETPRIFYMHVHGHGQAADLAARVKPALDLMGARAPGAAAGPVPAARALAVGPLDTTALARIIGHPGEQTGEVYKITIGRPDIDLREMGARINTRMGLNTWAAFAGSDAEAVVAGDIAMLESEVTPVLTALRHHDLQVVAIHHHMTGARPLVIFLHYWGKGPAGRLAQGVRAALDELGKHGAK